MGKKAVVFPPEQLFGKRAVLFTWFACATHYLSELSDSFLHASFLHGQLAMKRIFLLRKG